MRFFKDYFVKGKFGNLLRSRFIPYSILGEEARRLLAEVSAADRAIFFQDVKMIYHAIADNLSKHLPLKNMLLKDLHVLNPTLKSKDDLPDAMVRIARAIPKLLSQSEIDRVRYESMMYTAEDIQESWHIKNKFQDSDGNTHIEYHRVDFYWNKVLSITAHSGLPKYPVLSKLIKNVLILSHGNSDVERGFSINEHLVTEDRTLLSQSSINGLRSTLDGIHFFGSGTAHMVPIKAEMIRAVQKAKSLYNEEQLSLKKIVDAEKEAEEANKNFNQEIKILIEQEHELLSKQKELQDNQKKAQLLIGEGHERLDNALKKGDIIDAQAANALIGAGDEKVKSISEELIKVTNELIKIQSKRKNAFSHAQSFNNKKQKIMTTADDHF